MSTRVERALPRYGARRMEETKGERTRRRLLETAVDRFGQQGFRATSVSQVARDVGVTQAAVYAYFASKEDLFDAAVDHDAAEVIARAGERAAGVPVNQLVPLVLLNLLAELELHPLARRVVSGAEPDALGRLVDLPALATLREFIASEVATAQARGEVRPDIDPEGFADGAETILLSLVISVSQVGSSTVTRRQLGVIGIFDAALRRSP